MHTYHTTEYCPIYSAIAEGPGSLAKTLAFAAMRAETCKDNDRSPDSTSPTVPAPSSGT